MAQIFKAQRKAKQNKHLTVTVESLDHHGLGVCQSRHPVLFIEGALPGEVCKVRIDRQQKNHAHGTAQQILEPASQRQEPFCPHYQDCGGCQTQHIEPQYLQQARQQAVEQLIKRFAGTDAIPWCESISSAQQGYRRKTRLAIDNQHKGPLKVGFRGKNSNKVISVAHCPVLSDPLNAVLADLQPMLAKMKAVKRLGHVSLLQGDDGVQLCLRVKGALNEPDQDLLRQFGQQKGIQCVIQADSPEGYQTLDDAPAVRHYSPAPSVTLQVEPNDFIQVNGQVNQRMVAQALHWLQLSASDVVLDLFSGVGNFSLPMAQQAKQVIAIEGVDQMVFRAAQNAQRNLQSNIEPLHANLELQDWVTHTRQAGVNKVLLDPARAGAQFAVEGICQLQPERIVYVSCNPSTFARDVALFKQQGYQLAKINLIEMFPATSHTELMALLLPL